MKLRHNKKRNTAFLYEALVRELTKGILDKRKDHKEKVTSMIREAFGKQTTLYKELELYKALYETKGLKPRTAEKLVQEIKQAHKQIDKKRLFTEQSWLISKINKELSKDVFLNFVPNYKNLATISRIFDEDVATKNRVLLEEKVLSFLTSSKITENKNNKTLTDSLHYDRLLENFNKNHSENLHYEQKQLLSHYILSFSDNAVGLKIFLNEELGRLRYVVEESLNLKDVKEDESMVQKTKEVIDMLEGFKTKPILKEEIKQILKIQNLAREIEN